MCDESKFRAKVRQMQQERNKIKEKYRKDIQKLHNERKREEVEDMKGIARTENEIELAKIEDFKTSFWCDRAESYLVPLPDRANRDFWRRCGEFNTRDTLTDEGFKILKNDVHEEIKKICERRFIWVGPTMQLMSIATGLGGVAIAFLSLWLKK
jgi:hypothetical protein